MKTITLNKSLPWIYLLLAVLGAILPWQANLEFLQANPNGGFDITAFIQDANINAASRSLSRDLLVAASAFTIWIIAEGKRLKIKGWWITLILSVTISFACGGPLFLFLRERKLLTLSQEDQPKNTTKDQHPQP
jgi:hypothetical protein|tara:strand:+ start:3402 stop:3803 length:402 start_codon:yes stop_codon:yes gene_type:complete